MLASTEVDCSSLNLEGNASGGWWAGGQPWEGGWAGAREEGGPGPPTGAMAAEAPVASLLALISQSLTITGPGQGHQPGGIRRVCGCREADVSKVCHRRDLGQFCSLSQTLLRGSFGALKGTTGVRAVAGTAGAGTALVLSVSASSRPCVLEPVHFLSRRAAQLRDRRS